MRSRSIWFALFLLYFAMAAMPGAVAEARWEPGRVAAFVELGLGYLLIIGLLERPFALLITLVFFATTLIFGKLEVIGHTMLHAALIVFLIQGSAGRYPAPVRIHRRPRMRVAFASINFLLLLALLLVPYAAGARRMYETAREGELAPAQTDARPTALDAAGRD